MIRQILPMTIEVLQKSLDLHQQRQVILHSNIANAETPGFIAKDIRFEETLQRAAGPSAKGRLQATHPRHYPLPTTLMEDVEGRLVVRPSDDVGRDLNAVSVDQEMAALTTNAFHYNASAEILSRLFGSLRRAINEGRP